MTEFPDPPPGYHYNESRTYVPCSILHPFGFLATTLWFEQRPAEDLGEWPVIVDAADIVFGYLATALWREGWPAGWTDLDASETP